MVGFTRLLLLATFFYLGSSQDAFYRQRRKLKEGDKCTTTTLSQGKCTKIKKCAKSAYFVQRDGSYGYAYCGQSSAEVICCPVDYNIDVNKPDSGSEFSDPFGRQPASSDQSGFPQVKPGYRKLNFSISTSSRKNTDPTNYINQTLSGIQGSKDLLWTLEAPFYTKDSTNRATNDLFAGSYEVASLHLKNHEDESIEVRIGPNGSYKGLIHSKKRRIKSEVDVTVNTRVRKDTWLAQVVFPYETLPPYINSFNLFYTYKNDVQKGSIKILPTFVVATSSYQPINLYNLLPDFLPPSTYSNIWKQKSPFKHPVFHFSSPKFTNGMSI